jgi:hypothetical protein
MTAHLQAFGENHFHTKEQNKYAMGRCNHRQEEGRLSAFGVSLRCRLRLAYVFIQLLFTPNC